MLIFSTFVPARPVQTPATLQSDVSLNQKQGGEARVGCTSISPMAEDAWCAEMCASAVPNCPEDLCGCPEAQPGMSDLAVAAHPNEKELRPPHPRIVGGWTNCPEEAANGEVQNESDDFLVDAGHKLCHAEEEDGDADAANQLGPNKGNMPPATAEWGPSARLSWGANAVLPGKFGDADISPTDQSGDYLYKWVTFGGQNSRFMDVAAGGGNWADGWEETAEQDILDAGGTGCAFDEEGGVDLEDIQGKTASFIKEMRQKHKEWTFLYVPTCGGKINKYDPENGGPDYIAPMMYNTNHNSYPAMDLSVKPAANFIVDCIMMVHRAGWPAARTILTYQSFDAYRTREDSNLPFLLGQLLGNHSLTLPRGEVLRGPYAGVLSWPAQCGAGDGRCWPEVDRINTEQVRKGMKASNQYKEEYDEAQFMSDEEKQKKAAQQEMSKWQDNPAIDKTPPNMYEDKEEAKEDKEAAKEENDSEDINEHNEQEQEEKPEESAAGPLPVAPKPVAVAPEPVAVAPTPVPAKVVAPTPVPVQDVPVATSIPVPKVAAVPPVPEAPKAQEAKEEEKGEETEAEVKDDKGEKEEASGEQEAAPVPEAPQPLDHASAEQKVKEDIEAKAAADAAKEAEQKKIEEQERKEKKESNPGGWLADANKAAEEAATAAKKALEDASVARTASDSDAKKQEEEKHAAAAWNGVNDAEEKDEQQQAPEVATPEEEAEALKELGEQEDVLPDKAPDAGAMSSILGDANSAAEAAAAAAKKALDDASAAANEAREQRAADQRAREQEKRAEMAGGDAGATPVGVPIGAQ